MDSNTLKEYYGKYMRDIRGLSKSSVIHYYDALNHISRRLKDAGEIQDSIYEIRDLNILKKMREILKADPDFIELDTRGNRMYSAGLNRYIEFASGVDFEAIDMDVVKLDTPLMPDKPVKVEQTVWKRSNILRKQALALAHYSCEMNKEHESFIAERTGEPYMEGHHAIPMRLQESFDNSLDIYANIVCLCPICHRKIHYGMKCDRIDMINRIYDNRAERLANSGIQLDRQEFIDVIMSDKPEEGIYY